MGRARGALRVAALLAFIGCGSNAGGESGLAAPATLSASDGTSPGVVAITWAPVTGATSYAVWRDGVLLAEVTGTTYDDAFASPGGVPPPPTLTASQATFADRVELTWTAGEATPGPTHRYYVIAHGESAESASSPSDDGYRAAFPTENYELSLDGGAPVLVGLVSSYVDLSAPGSTIDPGIATASDGAFATHIALTLSGAGVVPPSMRNYALRSVNAAGRSAPALAMGSRSAAGTLTYQWQRLDPNSVWFVDIPGATSVTYDDIGTPATLVVPYRCMVSIDSTAMSTEVDRGWRAPAGTELARDDMWITDGIVKSMQIGNGAIYLGGMFRYVGPPTGSFAAVSSTTGAPDLSYARVNGPVEAAVSDGTGGWYVAGELASVDGMPVPRVIHLSSTGQLDASFRPSIGGSVRALALAGNTLYVAGAGVGSFPSHYGLVALDATTGAKTAWTPNATGDVNALAISGSVLYVAGEFTMMGGQPRNNLAALDVATGAATAWNPDAGGLAFNSVRTLAVAGSSIFVAGSFATIGGQTRSGLAALDAATGTATAWNPMPDQNVSAIVAAGNTIYVAGSFTSIGGQPRNALAALDATTGLATSWNPSPNGPVGLLALSGNTLYLAGSFQSVGGLERRGLAAVDVTTGTSTSWAPITRDEIRTLAAVGGTVFVGGWFTSVGGELRDSIAALDAATGALLPWKPEANDDVLALVLDGNTLYVGGLFTTIGGQSRRFIAAVDATTGLATSWNPDANNQVRALAVSGTTIYAGGFFTSIGGQARNRIAALDTMSGAATGWNPDANNFVDTIALGPGVVYVGGYFTSIGGVARYNIAALDATGAATTWNPGANKPVHTILISGGNVLVGGEFTAVGGQPRNALAALDGTTGLATAWNPDVRGSVRALAIAGSTLYVGGEFTRIGTRSAQCLVAIDAASGAPLAWNPYPSYENVNGHSSGTVEAVAVTANALYAGGWFTSVAGHVRQGVAVFAP